MNHQTRKNWLYVFYFSDIQLDFLKLSSCTESKTAIISIRFQDRFCDLLSEMTDILSWSWYQKEKCFTDNAFEFLSETSWAEVMKLMSDIVFSRSSDDCCEW